MSAVAIQARLHMMRSTGTDVTFCSLHKEAPLTAQIEGTQVTLAYLDEGRLGAPLGHAGLPASR